MGFSGTKVNTRVAISNSITIVVVGWSLFMVDNSWGIVHWGSMVDKGSVVDRGMVDKGDMVDTVGNMVDTLGNMVGSIEIRVMGSMVGAMKTIMMEGGMVNSMGAKSIIESMSNRKAILVLSHYLSALDF